MFNGTRMALFEIEDNIKLWTLLRTILEAKFNEAQGDRDILASPILAEISVNIVNVLKESGFDLDGQLDWDKLLSADDNPALVETIKPSIYYMSQLDIIDNKKEFLKNVFAPYSASAELIQELIDEMEK